jgi:hypothetical protein
MSLAVEKPSTAVVQSACILACREYARGYERTAWVFNGKHGHWFF